MLLANQKRCAKMLEIKYIKNTTLCRMANTFDPTKNGSKWVRNWWDMLDFCPGENWAMPAVRATHSLQLSVPLRNLNNPLLLLSRPGRLSYSTKDKLSAWVRVCHDECLETRVISLMSEHCAALFLWLAHARVFCAMIRVVMWHSLFSSDSRLDKQVESISYGAWHLETTTFWQWPNQGARAPVRRFIDPLLAGDFFLLHFYPTTATYTWITCSWLIIGFSNRGEG